MRKHTLRAASIGRGLRALLVATPLLIAAGFAACKDGPLPDYPVPDTALRLIPEQTTIGADGGRVFVVVELRQKADAGTPKHVVIYVRAKGATSEALPGPAFCADVDAGGGAGQGGQGGSAGGGGMGGGKATDEVSADLTIPDVALVATETYNARTGGFVLTVPSGTAPVDLVATAYEHDGGAEVCVPSQRQVLAAAYSRIERKSANADGGAGGAGGKGSGGSTSTGGGGQGGKGTTTSTGGMGGKGTSTSTDGG